MPTHLLTTDQAAERMKLSKPTLAKLRLNGGGPPFTKLGTRVFYTSAEIEEWVRSQPRYQNTAQVAESQRRPNAGRHAKNCDCQRCAERRVEDHVTT
jgi:excisionase family DNA binding protein